MNILMIGNGFDLAHGFPTKYVDFLDFCGKVIRIYEYPMERQCSEYEQKNLSHWNIPEDIKEVLRKAFASRKITSEKREITTGNKLLNDFYNLIKSNFWVNYFRMNSKYQKENWIDFENEIGRIIKSLDFDMHGKERQFELDDEIDKVSNEFLRTQYIVPQNIAAHTGAKYEVLTFKKIRNQLLNDLNKLIRALEIYIAGFVENIDCKVVSPDIKEIKYDKVLSFNYTCTYETVYDSKHISEYDYIHGKSDISNTKESNNMVLGIDEYLADERKNKDVEFIAFKKYFQRIYKKTGCKYKDWVDEIHSDKSIRNMERGCEDKNGTKVLTSEASKYHNLYIFGHSLDITDKDVLRDLILNDNVYTTIYYLNKDVMGQQIANLVKVIGQDELIRRTGGSTKTIEFKLQQDMVERGEKQA